ncbi:hypothetical protein [Silvibacterium dinghuense]|uniref:PH domain-containing protein n=1 Tax=Silvibacterium dinghuense TaxID=1560006 RepID=A0A4Q1SJR4_9BACT|nr:hypothetical protein [Silvibacterium dinghuense]RXS97896.1 hypothetical protein ESZ00_08575 [Silvibacterium dinghuense]GGH02818.1 hypothetical protein GCM10011586_18350 [Silvibacterium dinghuense]
MRFRRRLGANTVVAWVLSALFVGFVFLHAGRPPYAAVIAMVVVLLLYALPHIFWCWDVTPDRLVNRRYFSERSFVLAEIEYAGSMPGHLTPRRGKGAWIEVRTRAGERMIVQPADAEAFLAELQKYVPAAVKADDQPADK